MLQRVCKNSTFVVWFFKTFFRHCGEKDLARGKGDTERVY